MSADGSGGDNAIDQIDSAIEIEAKALRALVAVGEQWLRLQEAGREPTGEECALHAHLLGQWRRASMVLTELLERRLG